jgi:FixJ family two-component response regulator
MRVVVISPLREIKLGNVPMSFLYWHTFRFTAQSLQGIGATMNLLDSPPGDQALARENRCRPEIHIVDDDASVRRAMTRLLAVEDYSVFAYESAESFLAQQRDDTHGCIILDIALPGLDGVALQQALAARGNHMPVIFLTGHADVPTTVSAMKQGAVDFLEKPVDASVLLSTITRALERDDRLRGIRAQREMTDRRLSTLTPREREVLTHVMSGRLNKQIAADLGTAEKTVKVHRARGMEKMHVRSVAELVRIFERAHPREMDDLD